MTATTTDTDTMMKAFAIKEYKPMGDLSAVKEYQLPKPKPTGKDLLIRVKAVATNPIDYKRLANLGNHNEPFDNEKPLVVGWDASGIVEQVGDDTIGLFNVGDEVMFAGDFFRDGAYAEYVLVDERIVGKKPKSLDFHEAAAIPLTSLTAWEALIDQLKIPEPNDVKKNNENEGKIILITGGAGGVASASIQIAKKVLGLTVIATGSRPETIQYVKDMGADHVINHHKPIAEQVRALGIDQVDYILHGVDLTPDLFTEFIDLTKPFGGIVSVWPSAKVDLMELFWKSINFSAVLMFTRPGLKNDDKKRQHDILEKVSALTDSGVLVSREEAALTLTAENLRKALKLQASGKAIGKITLAFEE